MVCLHSASFLGYTKTHAFDLCSSPQSKKILLIPGCASFIWILYFYKTKSFSYFSLEISVFSYTAVCPQPRVSETCFSCKFSLKIRDSNYPFFLVLRNENIMHWFIKRYNIFFFNRKVVGFGLFVCFQG